MLSPSCHRPGATTDPLISTDEEKVMRTTPLSILAGAVLCAGVAGCGSSGPTTTTTNSSGGGAGPQGAAAAAFAYARCMRTHGVSDFPDPVVTTSPGQTSIKIRAVSKDSGSPQFTAAQQACQHLLPGPQNLSPAQRQAHAHALLAFARCLRSHGLANFPDPNTQGQITMEMITSAGINLHAPNVLPAARACVGVTHGVITGADVERAINGPH
jgi:hypothetical protein